MKFKVGDKVRIRKDLKASQKFRELYVDEDMLKYRGKIATIKEITLLGLGGYKIDLDDDRFYWTSDMFEPINKHFKSLPNDYTGTIEVENGYIVEKEILDEEEKEYLSAVIKPFRNRVEYIKKVGDSQEYIEILINDEFLNFPFFKKNTMYKGMKLGKAYTLKELGLDE